MFFMFREETKLMGQGTKHIMHVAFFTIQHCLVFSWPLFFAVSEWNDRKRARSKSICKKTKKKMDNSRAQAIFSMKKNKKKKRKRTTSENREARVWYEEKRGRKTS